MKAFFDAVAGGRNALLSLPGAIPIEGGALIIVDGWIVDALCVSGGTSQEDGEVAAEALAAMK